MRRLFCCLGISLSLADMARLSALYWESRFLILPVALGTTAQALSVYGVSCVPYGCKSALPWMKALTPYDVR